MWRRSPPHALSARSESSFKATKAPRDYLKGALKLGTPSRYVPVVDRLRTIGGLAKAAGVPTSTIRYYERAGLLRPSGRTLSNYRFYTNEDLCRLRFVRGAQATGFTLDDIRQLLRPAACHRVQGLIEARLKEVGSRVSELRHFERVLRDSLALCRAHAATGRCRVVDTLSTRARRD